MSKDTSKNDPILDSAFDDIGKESSPEDASHDNEDLGDGNATDSNFGGDEFPIPGGAPSRLDPDPISEEDFDPTPYSVDDFEGDSQDGSQDDSQDDTSAAPDLGLDNFGENSNSQDVDMDDELFGDIEEGDDIGDESLDVSDFDDLPDNDSDNSLNEEIDDTPEPGGLGGEEPHNSSPEGASDDGDVEEDDSDFDVLPDNDSDNSLNEEIDDTPEPGGLGGEDPHNSSPEGASDDGDVEEDDDIDNLLGIDDDVNSELDGSLVSEEVDQEELEDFTEDADIDDLLDDSSQSDHDEVIDDLLADEDDASQGDPMDEWGSDSEPEEDLDDVFEHNDIDESEDLDDLDDTDISDFTGDLDDLDATLESSDSDFDSESDSKDLDEMLNDLRSESDETTPDEPEPETKNTESEPKPKVKGKNKRKAKKKDKGRDMKDGGKALGGVKGSVSAVAFIVVALASGAASSYFMNSHMSDGSDEGLVVENKVNQLSTQVSSELIKINNRVDSQEADYKALYEKLLSDYERLAASQEEAYRAQIEQNKIISEIKAEASKYEGEMLSRLERLLTFTRGVAERQDGQAVKIKDEVMREAVALLEERSDDRDGDRLIQLSSQLRESIDRVNQIEASVLAQRNRLSMIETETEHMKERVNANQGWGNGSMPSILTPLSNDSAPSRGDNSNDKQEDSESDEACCIHVDTIAETPSKTRVSTSHSETDAPTRQETPDTTYYVMGVFAKGQGSYDIYLQRSDAANSTEFEQYHLSQNRASTLPGYGRILRVEKMENSSSKIPYVIVTEKGDIRGRR